MIRCAVDGSSMVSLSRVDARQTVRFGRVVALVNTLRSCWSSNRDMRRDCVRKLSIFTTGGDCRKMICHALMFSFVLSEEEEEEEEKEEDKRRRQGEKGEEEEDDPLSDVTVTGEREDGLLEEDPDSRGGMWVEEAAHLWCKFRETVTLSWSCSNRVARSLDRDLQLVEEMLMAASEGEVFVLGHAANAYLVLFQIPQLVRRSLAAVPSLGTRKALQRISAQLQDLLVLTFGLGIGVVSRCFERVFLPLLRDPDQQVRQYTLYWAANMGVAVKSTPVDTGVSFVCQEAMRHARLIHAILDLLEEPGLRAACWTSLAALSEEHRGNQRLLLDRGTLQEAVDSLCSFHKDPPLPPSPPLAPHVQQQQQQQRPRRQRRTVTEIKREREEEQEELCEPSPDWETVFPPFKAAASQLSLLRNVLFQPTSGTYTSTITGTPSAPSNRRPVLLLPRGAPPISNLPSIPSFSSSSSSSSVAAEGSSSSSSSSSWGAPASSPLGFLACRSAVACFAAGAPPSASTGSSHWQQQQHQAQALLQSRAQQDTQHSLSIAHQAVSLLDSLSRQQEAKEEQKLPPSEPQQQQPQPQQQQQQQEQQQQQHQKQEPPPPEEEQQHLPWHSRMLPPSGAAASTAATAAESSFGAQSLSLNPQLYRDLQEVTRELCQHENYLVALRARDLWRSMPA